MVDKLRANHQPAGTRGPPQNNRGSDHGRTVACVHESALHLSIKSQARVPTQPRRRECAKRQTARCQGTMGYTPYRSTYTCTTGKDIKILTTL